MKARVKSKKTFDAVAAMRSIRERVSKEIQGMTFEEEKAYLKRRSDQFLKAKASTQQKLNAIAG